MKSGLGSFENEFLPLGTGLPSAYRPSLFGHRSGRDELAENQMSG